MRKPILVEAQEVIAGDRQASYGDARMGFTHVAAQWSLYMFQKHGVEIIITPEDVCWMMADLKKVRQMAGFKRDNVMDAAGYIGLIEQVAP